MKLRNEKGITIITLCIMIIVLMVISSITFLESSSQLQIKNVNSLYSDIETLNTAVSGYYLEKEKLPIRGNLFCENPEKFSLTYNGVNGINSNDNGAYYVLDLSKMENLTLNYGRQYKEWNIDSDSSTDKITDIYVINETSHQIYYIKGIKLHGEIYHTSPM